MINIIMGLNGQGKTLYIENLLSKKINEGEIVVSNLPNSLTVNKIDKQKANILASNMRLTHKILNGTDIKYSNTQLFFDGDEEYTNAFVNIVTLLCKQGNVLILDEPDIGLNSTEVYQLYEVLVLLLPMYKEAFISMHCQELLGMEDVLDVKYYWMDQYQIYNVSEEAIYGAIGKI